MRTMEMTMMKREGEEKSVWKELDWPWLSSPAPKTVVLGRRAQTVHKRTLLSHKLNTTVPKYFIGPTYSVQLCTVSHIFQILHNCRRIIQPVLIPSSPRRHHGGGKMLRLRLCCRSNGFSTMGGVCPLWWQIFGTSLNITKIRLNLLN